MAEMKKVLIVEDDLGISKALSGSLERAGFKVSTACDASSGVCQVAGDDFDAILLDIIMPGADVTLFLEAVEQKYGNCGKVIIITNLDDAEAEQRVSDYNVSAILVKSRVNLSDIHSMIWEKSADISPRDGTSAGDRP